MKHQVKLTEQQSMVKPEKIAKNVYLVGSGSLSGSGDCMVYAIGLENNEICLIDAGTNNADQIIRNLENTPLKEGLISHLVLTHVHFDHIGAAHQFKKRYPNLNIIAHEKDTPGIEGERGTTNMTAASWYGSKLNPVKVDKKIEGEQQTFCLSGEKLIFFHTPGHTPGSMSVVYKTQGRNSKTILFGQDIHGPFMDVFKSNIKDWARSMEFLISLDADILCEGHYGIYRGKENVKKFIRKHLRQQGF